MHPISQTQKQESERMFMAGYAACFFRIMETANLSPDDSAKVFEAIQNEVTDYHRLLGKIPGPRGVERG